MANTRSKSSSKFDGADFMSAEFKQEIMAVIKDAVNDAVKELTDLISENLKRIESTMNNRIQSLEDRVSELEGKLLELSHQNTMAMLHANANEQYSRRHNIRIVGFDEEQDEDCEEKTLKFLNEKMEVPLQLNDIDRAHRVGRRNPTSNKPSRAIIVRLLKHKHKIAILKNKKKLKGSKYFVNEDLSNRNQQLLYNARKALHAKQPGPETEAFLPRM